MKTLKLLIAICVVLLYAPINAQQTPASKQTEPISIVGATIHIGNGTTLANATLIFENGIITAIGPNIPAKGKQINAQGKHIYPGFIAAATSLGLVEIDAVRPTNDKDEIGDFIPHIRSLIAYNAESAVVESMRPNGVLLAQVSPKGGRISGTSSIMQLDAWNWEDAAIKQDDAIHLNWPRISHSNKQKKSEILKSNKKYQDQITKVLTFLTNAKVYNQTNNKEKNKAFEATKGIFSGKQSLFVYAQSEKQIIDAIHKIKAIGVKKMVLVGAYEANKTIELLKKHNIPVLVRAPHKLPLLEDDDYDFPYKLPKILVDAGILVGIQNVNSANFQIRNLPFYAGQVASQGLNKEIALKLISGNTAKILGIDARYGSLEVNKSATLFISEGDALDMRSNQLSHAFIDGRELSLESHQTKLWKRYTKKYSEK